MRPGAPPPPRAPRPAPGEGRTCARRCDPRLQRREHVLPDGVAGAGVVEADDALLALRAEALQEGKVLGRDHLACPLDREARPPREVVERYLAGDSEVVVAGQAHGCMIAG